MKHFIHHKTLRRSMLLMVPASLFLLSAFLFAPQSSDWEAPASAKDKKNPVASDEASIAAGKKMYEKECLSCHGKKGKGDGPKAAEYDKATPDMTTEKFHKETDGEIFWKITEGKKPMPSAKKTLTEEQRWQVINYVRTLKKK